MRVCHCFPLAPIFIISSFCLSGQQFVDVLPEAIYIQEHHDVNGRGILKINPDLSVEHFLPPTLPKGFDLKNMIVGIRPKIRSDNYWISDTHKIYKRPLDAKPDQEWELVKLPNGVVQFSDFEIISDKEAIICGCVSKTESFDETVLIHFIFNYHTGAITTAIESLNLRDILLESDPDIRGRTQMKILKNYMCRFNSRIIIVGKYSGLVTAININDNGKFINSRKYEIVPKDELPSDPKEAIHNGSAIAWIGPLFGDDVLICCRLWVVPDKDPSKSTSVYCFRTLNLKTGKITFEGTSYRDKMAESYLTLYEESGELLSVRDVISKHLESLEQAKMSKSNSKVSVNKDEKEQPLKI